MLGESAQQYDPRTLAERFERLNAGHPADRITLREGLDLSIDPRFRDDWRPFSFDPTNARELDTFLRVASHRKRLLDVGAYSGTFSLVFTKRAGAQALAVEPSPLVLPGLRTNLRLNPAHHVRVHEGALGAEAGLVPMQQEGIHYIGAELRPYMPETATMKVMPGDDLLADHRFVPDMIKIDVEGFEQRVLAGLTNTLDRFRPDLHIEVHGPWLGMFRSSLQEIHAMLTMSGYRMFLLDGRELDQVAVEAMKDQMFHMSCTHRTTAWADFVQGCL
jgi:FkbM family methyltransferase